MSYFKSPFKNNINNYNKPTILNYSRNNKKKNNKNINYLNTNIFNVSNKDFNIDKSSFIYNKKYEKK